MINWSDFVSFRQMITPVIVRILFWVGVVVVFLVGLKVMMTEDFGGGLILMVAGPVVVRIVSEVILVPFLIHDRLTKAGPAPPENPQ